MALPRDTDDSGVFAFQLGAQSGWATDSKNYQFGPYSDGKSLDVSVSKSPPSLLTVDVRLGDLAHTFSITIPPLLNDSLKIVLIWGQGWMALQVDDKTLSSGQLKPAAH